MKAIRNSLVALGGLAAAAALVICASTPAAAWYCSARGTTGASGWGTSPNLGTAKTIALRECAVRTPRGAACYIMYCK